MINSYVGIRLELGTVVYFFGLSINDKDFVERLSLYQDDFSVTKRKVNAPNKD
jgi:hypothetical protein